MQFHMWPSVVFTDIRLKMWTGKKLPMNGSLRENVSIFLIRPSSFNKQLLALISRRNVGTRGHLRKEIVLLKYQFFRFRTKSGAHFELLNWFEKKFLMAEIERIVILLFYHLLGWFWIENLWLYRTTSAFPCLTCTQQLMTKAGVKFGMLWRLYKFKI